MLAMQDDDDELTLSDVFETQHGKPRRWEELYDLTIVETSPRCIITIEEDDQDNEASKIFESLNESLMTLVKSTDLRYVKHTSKNLRVAFGLFSKFFFIWCIHSVWQLTTEHEPALHISESSLASVHTAPASSGSLGPSRQSARPIQHRHHTVVPIHQHHTVVSRPVSTGQGEFDLANARVLRREESSPQRDWHPRLRSSANVASDLKTVLQSKSTKEGH